ncbi:hypothetical protein A0H81_02044 [Grifola frondosa]|uniref:Uncharacterized protein n=1 Tax=Grifola frondosa TaxID=5627 RepID=A0A1C7MK99_GRIFR|nr:hypothetical protein A0H81_02044 [Grifola frondosa]
MHNYITVTVNTFSSVLAFRLYRTLHCLQFLSVLSRLTPSPAGDFRRCAGPRFHSIRHDRTALDSSEVDDDLVDQPSLGYLDGALEFIAAEREKWAAQRDSGLRGNGSTATSDSAWRHVVQPRRKRQRKRNRSVQDTRRLEQEGEEGVATIGSAADGTAETSGNYEDEDADDSSSSLTPHHLPNITSRRLPPTACGFQAIARAHIRGED